MKIAILSNATVEMLARMLGGEHAVWTAPGFGAWMEIALAPPADLISFFPDIIAILLDGKFSKDDARSFDDRFAVVANGRLDAFVQSTYLLEDDTADSYCYPAICETKDGILVSYYHSDGSDVCLNSTKVVKVLWSELD